MLISNCESFRGRILFVSVIFILLHFPPKLFSVPDWYKNEIPILFWLHNLIKIIILSKHIFNLIQKRNFLEDNCLEYVS